MTAYVIPIFIGFVIIFGMIKRVDVFSVFIDGAKEGLQTSIKIIPALVALMTCVGMFKASGCLDILSYSLKPIMNFLNFPTELVPLTLLRPISGSGALVIFEDTLKTYGADSTIGRIASVLMGSTETTFYTIAVYYGALKIKQTRHTLLCSLSSDVTGFIVSAMLVYMFF